jgi:hypothetical protein
MTKLNYKNKFFVLLSSIFLYGCGSDGGYKEAFYSTPDYPLQRDIRHVETGWKHFWYRQGMRKQCYENMQQDVWDFVMQ